MANLNPFSKVLQKQAGRAKERLLQNFGKADRTTDEDFDLHVKNFSKQQGAVLRLQKEFKNYHQCLKAMQMARRSLMDTVSELYEPCWDGVEDFLMKIDISDSSFEEFCVEVNNQILCPVANYLCQFPELTNKISKRNRKLLDYDNSRHNLQNLETMKKKEDSKLAKAKEQLDDARNNFDTINKELHEELPTLYDSRVEFFATYLQSLFLIENKFCVKDSLICADIGELLGKLKESPKKTQSFQDSETEDCEIGANLSSPEDESANAEHENNKTNTEGEVLMKTMFNIPVEKRQEVDTFSESASGDTDFSTPTTTIDRNSCFGHVFEAAVSKENGSGDKVVEINQDVPKQENDVPPVKNAVVVDPVSSDTHAGSVLYQVQGTYKYVAEDADELSFDVGDTIDVVEYDDPEEQEEGWLMGVFNGKKGLFPANFTARK